MKKNQYKDGIPFVTSLKSDDQVEMSSGLSDTSSPPKHTDILTCSSSSLGITPRVASSKSQDAQHDIIRKNVRGYVEGIGFGNATITNVTIDGDKVHIAVCGDLTRTNGKTGEDAIAKAIDQQTDQQVVFFNVKSKKAFFSVTPEEARLAMDHVRNVREGLKSSGYPVEVKPSAEDRMAIWMAAAKPVLLSDLAGPSQSRNPSRDALQPEGKYSLIRNHVEVGKYECLDQELLIRMATKLSVYTGGVVDGVVVGRKALSDLSRFGVWSAGELTNEEPFLKANICMSSSVRVYVMDELDKMEGLPFFLFALDMIPSYSPGRKIPVVSVISATLTGHWTNNW